MYKFFLSLRYLIRRRISYFAIGGVAIGVAALIIVNSVMMGFRNELRQRIRGTSAHISVSKRVGGVGRDTFIGDYNEIISKIKQVDGVEDCAPRIEWFGMCENTMTAVMLVGVVPEAEEKVTGFKQFLKCNTKADFSTPANIPQKYAGAIVGSAVFPGFDYRKSNEYPYTGIDITVVTSPPHTGQQNDPVRAHFTITGVFHSGMYEYDHVTVYVPLEELQKLIFAKGLVNVIRIKLRDYKRAEEIKSKLVDLLKDYNITSVRTWEDEKRNFLTAVEIERNVTAVIIFFTIIVASFNIISILMTMVAEKMVDIGVITALGATARGISTIFLMIGFFIGIFGCLFGILLAYLIIENLNPLADFIEKTTGIHPFPSNIYLLDKIPSDWDPGTNFIFMGLTLLVCLIFSIYPAYRAGKLNPIEALRHE